MSSSQLAYDKDKTKIIAEVALVSFLCVSTRRAVNTEESRTFFLRTWWPSRRGEHFPKKIILGERVDLRSGNAIFPAILQVILALWNLYFTNLLQYCELGNIFIARKLRVREWSYSNWELWQLRWNPRVKQKLKRRSVTSLYFTCWFSHFVRFFFFFFSVFCSEFLAVFSFVVF